MWLQGGVDEDEKIDFAETGRVLRRTGAMLEPYRAQAIKAVVLLVCWTATVVAGPLLIRWAVDGGIRGDQPGVLAAAVIGYLLAACTGYWLYRGSIVAVAEVGQSFLRDLRVRTFDRLVEQSLGFYDRNKAGVLISRMTSDIDSLGELAQFGLTFFATAALQLVGTLIALFLLSPRLLAVCLVVVPIVGVATVLFQRASNRAYLRVRDEIGDTLSALAEGVSGVRVVQAFAREPERSAAFAQANGALYRSHLRSVRVVAAYVPVVDVAGVVTTAGALALGAVLVDRGSLSVGTVVAFILLLQGLFEPIQTLSQLFNLLQSATASLSKLFALIDEPDAVPTPHHPVAVPARGPMALDDVTFSYPGAPAPAPAPAPALRHASLKIGEGERVAVVGPTGAGKSTVAKLLSRMYDPDSGLVTFAEVSLATIDPAALRSRVVVVPQEGHLFSGTVAENVRLSRPGASDADLWRALERIGVAHRFAELPQGLETEVRDRGSRLSAGERQLVSLARVALVDPAVLILDEATSSLDPGTEQLVETALEKLMEDRSVVIIAHRMSTAERADRIVVVDGGELAEVGTHAELLAADGPYAVLYAAWSRQSA